jgi:hypothetical protein
MTGWPAILRAAAVEAENFRSARADPFRAQSALLRRILRGNAECEFGRQHGFASIKDIEGFRSRVPIRTYDELQPWIARASNGETEILTTEPIVAFEETGGSVSGGKLVPYTASALRAFRAAVLPWLWHLSVERPGAFVGKTYAAISPATRAPRVSGGGHPVGLPSDAAYLGDDLVTAFIAISAVPADVGRLSDVTQWRFVTLLHLLACEDLTFISVWSPTFLTALVDALPALAPSLIRALHDGLPASGAGTPVQSDPHRARIIEAALGKTTVDTRAIWPRLDTISAWADGPSRAYARRLREAFPHAQLQPKGLLATEGPVTIPLPGSTYPVPALTSAVFEFIDDAGRPLLCDELRDGAAYRVVMTTPGGLYRYDLGDRVRCHGMTEGLPQLEFLGRANVSSDLVGEKLTEEFVARVLATVDAPACLIAHNSTETFYELLVSAEGEQLASISERIESGLRENPQYAYARAMGQLGPLRPHALPGLLDIIMTTQATRGRRLGDIKPPSLVCDPHLGDLLRKQVDYGANNSRVAFTQPAASRKIVA